MKTDRPQYLPDKRLIEEYEAILQDPMAHDWQRNMAQLRLGFLRKRVEREQAPQVVEDLSVKKPKGKRQAR